MSRQPDAASARVSGQSERPGHRLGKRRREHKRQVADPGHGDVVVGGTHADRGRAHGDGHALDPLDVFGPGVGAGHDHPRPIDEQRRVRGLIARRLATGHRMAADEGEPQGVGPVHDGSLRADDIGDGGGRAQGRPPRTGQRVERGERVEGRPGEDHEIRPLDGIRDGGCGLGQRAVDERLRRAAGPTGSTRPATSRRRPAGRPGRARSNPR